MSDLNTKLWLKFPYFAQQCAVRIFTCLLRKHGALQFLFLVALPSAFSFSPVFIFVSSSGRMLTAFNYLFWLFQIMTKWTLMLNQVHSACFFNINLTFSGNQRKKLQSPLHFCLFLRKLFLPVSGDLLNSETLETVVAVKLHSGDGKMHHRGGNKQQL